MKKVYLDNASTTAIRAEVIQEMTKVMAEDFETLPQRTVLAGMQSVLNFPKINRQAIECSGARNNFHFAELS
jgi:cysteine sulfinate desulfinase/cysteine desulfurase-like protein